DPFERFGTAAAPALTPRASRSLPTSQRRFRLTRADLWAMSAPPDELPGRTRPSVRRVRLAFAVLVVIVTAVLLLPDLLGLDHRSPFAQLVAFRPALLAGLLGLAVVASVVAVVRRRGWTLAGGLLGVALVGGAMVLPRALPAVDVPEPDASAARTLTVLAFNTYEGDGNVDALAALIHSARP